MSKIQESDERPLSEVELGDVVILPDGRGLTARGKVELEGTVGSMTGFVVCGELEVLLSIPAGPSSPINVYVRIPSVPSDRVRTAFHGVMSYWAPHLPSITGAMAELPYRVLEVQGSIDPIVILWRGEEPVIFMRATFAYPDDIKVLHMPRTDANDYDVARHAGVVDAPVAAPAREVRPLPQRVTKPLRRKVNN